MEEINTQKVTEATIVEETTPVAEVPSVQTVEPTTKTSFFSKRNVVAIVIIIVGVVVSGVLFYIRHNTVDAVAVVDGVKISREEFNKSVEMIAQNAASQGINVTDPKTKAQIDKQAIDVLINNTLLLQGAKDAGVTSDAAKVQAEYDGLVKELGGQDALNKRMAEVGLTEEKLRKNISERLVANAYIETQTDIKNISVTDEEIQAFYEAVKKESSTTPPLAEIKTQVESQILGQKRQEVVDKLITSLREKAKITTSIEDVK